MLTCKMHSSEKATHTKHNLINLILIFNTFNTILILSNVLIVNSVTADFLWELSLNARYLHELSLDFFVENGD
jgi:hypothetical protein